MSKTATIEFSGTITPVKSINDRFTLCKCYVMALGKNRNKSYIPKSAVDKALPSLYNIPVVGHLYVDDDGEFRMGGHDMELQRDGDGKLQFRVLTVPYGVVPLQDNVHYETVKEGDGTEAEYLVADVILWTGQYPEMLDAKIGEEVLFSQSMEITPQTVRDVGGYAGIEEFSFSALCLLGKGVEPCFPSARVEPYFGADHDEWARMFAEFKKELGETGCYALNPEEGVKMELEEQPLVFEAAAPEEPKGDDEKTEPVPEEIVTPPVEEKTEEEAAPAEEAPVEEAVPAEGESAEDAKPVMFSLKATANEMHEKLWSAVLKLNYEGDTFIAEHRLMDWDDEFVYVEKVVYDQTVTTTYIRIPYTNDDNVVLAEDKQEEIFLCWLTKNEKEKIAADRELLKELMDYKATRLEDDKRKAYGAIIAEFADLAEIDEYKTTVKDAMTFETEDALRERLYAIRGKNIKEAPRKSIDAIHIPVGATYSQIAEDEKPEKRERAEFMKKYGNNK